MRFFLAVWLARIVGWVSRITGRGGSSLPGLVARRVDSEVFRRITARLPGGVVLLTGTNGKTTTAAIVSYLLRQSGLTVVHNRSGANLIVGLTATLVQASRWRLYPDQDLALLETDEATMPRAAEESHPRIIMVTNFFRDQLDRYGELSTTVNFVKQGIQSLDPEGWLVLNADDPQVAYLGESVSRVVYFGADLSAYPTKGSSHDVADARFCPRCGNELRYRRQYYAHLGDYHCPVCQYRRPVPDVLLVDWPGSNGKLRIDYRGKQLMVPNRLPGLYNAYNIMAAMAVALLLDTDLDRVTESLASFRPAFGRMEEIVIDGCRLWLALVKNPVGFNQVLEAVGQDTRRVKNLLFIINDRYADGQDVSWLWDVDFERFVELDWNAWVSGIRAKDMAVRLLYAGLPPDRVHVVEKPEEALEMMTHYATSDQGYYILPTYTALLDIRKYLTDRGYTRHFREG
ncbi:MAG: Mur ligase family protein [Firmicutes bacterium]|uniref:Lipid II isoglutaminyl synthase (glutamine-hydrolyzing) subunit MurT n=1 Tax=Sulfobacillus benefaciens TaxID=453960 RepID=A0A2T2WX26_9FIRM|nr:Mur ligase family protein [Bacillota bacterium]MCL5014016.1 Mur ligase family protein [Bacillota bacterium]PSR26789.1 MAG: DUF1727 domain-containing protein [Sulfobacillus benefaciens]